MTPGLPALPADQDPDVGQRAFSKEEGLLSWAKPERNVQNVSACYRFHEGTIQCSQWHHRSHLDIFKYFPIPSSMVQEIGK